MGKRFTRNVVVIGAIGAMTLGAIAVAISARALMSKGLYEADFLLRADTADGDGISIQLSTVFSFTLALGLLSIVTASLGYLGAINKHRGILKMNVLVAPVLGVCYVLVGAWLTTMLVSTMPELHQHVAETCRADTYPSLMKEVGCDMPVAPYIAENADTSEETDEDFMLLQTGEYNPSCSVIVAAGIRRAKVFTVDDKTARATPVFVPSHQAYSPFADSTRSSISEGFQTALNKAWLTCTGGNIAAPKPSISAYGTAEFRFQWPDVQQQMWDTIRKAISPKFRPSVLVTLAEGEEAFGAFIAANVEVGTLTPPALSRNKATFSRGTSYSGVVHVGAHTLQVAFAGENLNHVWAHSFADFGLRAVFSWQHKNPLGRRPLWLGSESEGYCAMGSNASCPTHLRPALNRLVTEVCPAKQCVAKNKCACPVKVHWPHTVKQFSLIGTYFFDMLRATRLAVGMKDTEVFGTPLSLSDVAHLAAKVCGVKNDDALARVCDEGVREESKAKCVHNKWRMVTRLCIEMTYISLMLETVLDLPAEDTTPRFFVSPQTYWEHGAYMRERSGAAYDGPAMVDVATDSAADVERKVFFRDMGWGKCYTQHFKLPTEYSLIADPIGETQCRKKCKHHRQCWGYSVNLTDACLFYLEPVVRASGLADDWDGSRTSCTVLRTSKPDESWGVYFEDLGAGYCLDVKGKKSNTSRVAGHMVGERACRMYCTSQTDCAGYEVDAIGNCNLHQIKLSTGSGGANATGTCVALHRDRHHDDIVSVPKQTTPVPATKSEKMHVEATSSTKDSHKTTTNTTAFTTSGANEAETSEETESSGGFFANIFGGPSASRLRRLKADRELSDDIKEVHNAIRDLAAERELKVASCGAVCKQRAAAFNLLGDGKCSFLRYMCDKIDPYMVGEGHCLMAKSKKAPSAVYQGVGPFTTETCGQTCFTDIACIGFEFSEEKSACRIISPNRPDYSSTSINWVESGSTYEQETHIGAADGTKGYTCYRKNTHHLLSQFQSYGDAMSWTCIILGSILLLSFQFGCCFLVSISNRRKSNQSLCRKIFSPWGDRKYDTDDHGTVLLKRDSTEDLSSTDSSDSDGAAE